MTPIRLILAILATFRLARILSKDTISDQLRAIPGRWAAGKDKYTWQWYLAEWINCPFCTGVWIAAGIAFLAAGKTDRKSYVLNLFAIAGGQTLLTMLTERGIYDES